MIRALAAAERNSSIAAWARRAAQHPAMARQVFSPDETVRRGYTWRALVHFAGFLGLATVESASHELLCHEYQVKALPLLGHIVQFQLTL